MSIEKSLIVPVSTKSTNQTIELKIKGSFLFIGANGSGKTLSETGAMLIEESLLIVAVLISMFSP